MWLTNFCLESCLTAASPWRLGGFARQIFHADLADSMGFFPPRRAGPWLKGITVDSLFLFF